ncbi:MAG: hypothetical protein HYX76_04785 [Acidobacteria bacterium]|nr:hypothetical protein [Acidobacteriota bacterium]
MIDREKVLAVLRKRFAGAPADRLAAAANAIVGLDDDWEDVTDDVGELGSRVPVSGQDHCCLSDGVHPGSEWRIFRKRAVS